MSVSKLILDERNFLYKLSKSKSQKKFYRIISKASSRQLLSFVEIIFNILQARIHLNSIEKVRLQKHAELLRQLSQARSEQKARSLLLQRGGSLPLLALLAPVLIEIVKSLAERIV